MNFVPSRKTVRQLKLSGVFLICLALLLGGCQAPRPPLSPEAKALKKQLLGNLKKLTPQLIGPVAQEDWPAANSILETAYKNMQQEGKLVPEMIVVLDRNAITQARFPSPHERRYDFSNYAPAKKVFNEKSKVQAALYFKGTKIFVVIAPILQDNNLVGGVALAYPADALEKQWHVSEKEFMSLNLN
jgi:hypothetical protein